MRGSAAPEGATNVSNTDCAYIAGQLDADGSIGIYEQSRTVSGTEYASVILRVTLYSQDRNLLEWIQESFGGTITRSHGCYYWLLTGDYVTFLSKVAPYMRTKRRQAELALEYKSWIANGESRKQSTESRQKRFEFVTRSKTLNMEVKEAFNGTR